MGRWLLLAATGLLIVRLVLLQVVDGDYYRVLADENRVKLVIEAAERGKILDRHGEVLAEDREGETTRNTAAVGDNGSSPGALTEDRILASSGRSRLESPRSV